MGYEMIDLVLNEWAKFHGLPIQKEYKDSEVRSVQFYKSQRDGYEIWIDKPDGNGLIGIHVWDFRRRGRRRDFLVSPNDLREYLDAALNIAKSWA